MWNPEDIKHIENQIDDEIDYSIHFWWKNSPNCRPMSEITLMLYTGIKDKNETKIFEGDILKQGKEVRKVEYIDWLCGFAPFCEWDEYERFRPNFTPDKCEIIGNIFENADLLNAKGEINNS